MAVVVQRMVFPRASGILFTADPITGNRTVGSIDASFGIGEALVSGLVTADLYQVRSGTIVTRRIATKTLAIRGLHDGGTVTEEVPATDQERQALPDELILEYVSNGEVLTTGRAYANTYIGVYRFRDGRIWQVKEFHNPLITERARSPQE